MIGAYLAGTVYLGFTACIVALAGVVVWWGWPRIVALAEWFVAVVRNVGSGWIVAVLGATALFPAAVQEALALVVLGGCRFIIRLGGQFRTGWYDTSYECEVAESWVGCAVAASASWVAIIPRAILPILAGASYDRFYQLVLAFLVTLVIGGTLASNDRSVLPVWLRRSEDSKAAWRATEPTLARNLLLIFVLMVGGYLSLAAIVVLPLVDPTEDLSESGFPDAFAPTNLQEALLAEVGSESDAPLAGSRHLDDLQAFLEGELADCGPAPSLPTSTRSAEPTSGADDRCEALWRFDAEATALETMEREALAAAEVLRLKQKQIIRRTVSAFRVENAGRVGVQATKAHFRRLFGWHTDTHESLARKIEECRTGSLVPIDAWSRDALAVLRNVRDGNPALPADRELRRCDLPGSYPLPERPDVGDQLGTVFAFIASWLLKAESQELVLVVGMIGFGLFGSSVARFVRAQLRPTHELGASTAQDLSSVVVLGVSAAMVVFLGVKGGLAIFAMGTGDPNPYVLLFTCLVAAVFSEEVWAATYKYFGGQLAKANKAADDAAAAPEEPEPPVEPAPPAGGQAP